MYRRYRNTKFLDVLSQDSPQNTASVYESGVTISLATWNAAIKELNWIFSDVPAARRYLKQWLHNFTATLLQSFDTFKKNKKKQNKKPLFVSKKHVSTGSAC